MCKSSKEVRFRVKANVTVRVTCFSGILADALISHTLMMMHTAYLVGDSELSHDLVNVDSRDDVDNRLTTDVVALDVQRLQRLVLVQCGCQCLHSLGNVGKIIIRTAGHRLILYNYLSVSLFSSQFFPAS